MKIFNRKTILSLVMLVTLATQAFLPTSALASVFDEARSGTKKAVESSGMNVEENVSFPQIFGGIFNAILGIMGVILLVLLIYAGGLWMTAGGNQDQVAKAKGMITNAVVGLIIVMMAYVISTFVLSEIISATT